VSVGPVGKNWVGRFTSRYKDAGYLRTIDSARVKADNIYLIDQFYKQVSIYRSKYFKFASA